MSGRRKWHFPIAFLLLGPVSVLLSQGFDCAKGQLARLPLQCCKISPNIFGFFPQGLDRDWEEHCWCSLAWQPWQSGDCPPQCGCGVCVPGLTCPSQLTACSAETFPSLVVMDEAFLILSFSSGIEHQRRLRDVFPYPLESFPF